MVSKTDVFTRKTSIPTSESRFGVEDRNEVAIRETLQRRGEKAQYQHYERQAIPMKEGIIKQLKDEIEYYKDRIESAKEDEQRYKQYAREASSESSADRYDERRREARNEQSAYKRAISAIEKELNKYEKIEDPLMIVGYGDKFGNEVIRYGNDIVRNEKANFKAELRYEKELKAAKDKVIAAGGKVEGGLGYDSSGNVIQIFDSQGQKTYQNMLKNQSLASGQPIYLNDASGKLTAVVYDGKYVATTNREWAEQQVAKSQPVVTSPSKIYLDPKLTTPIQLPSNIATPNLITPALGTAMPGDHFDAKSGQYVRAPLGVPSINIPKPEDYKPTQLERIEQQIKDISSSPSSFVPEVRDVKAFGTSMVGDTFNPIYGTSRTETFLVDKEVKLNELANEYRKASGVPSAFTQTMNNLMSYLEPSTWREETFRRQEPKIKELSSQRDAGFISEEEYQKLAKEVLTNSYWMILGDYAFNVIKEVMNYQHLSNNKINRELEVLKSKRVMTQAEKKRYDELLEMRRKVNTEITNTDKILDIWTKNKENANKYKNSVDAQIQFAKGGSYLTNAITESNILNNYSKNYDFESNRKKIDDLLDKHNKAGTTFTSTEIDFINDYNKRVDEYERLRNSYNNNMERGAKLGGIEYETDENGNITLDKKFMDKLNPDFDDMYARFQKLGVDESTIKRFKTYDLWTDLVVQGVKEYAKFKLIAGAFGLIGKGWRTLNPKVIEIGKVGYPTTRLARGIQSVKNLPGGSAFLNSAMGKSLAGSVAGRQVLTMIGTEALRTGALRIGFGALELGFIATQVSANYQKAIGVTDNIRVAIPYAIATAVLYKGIFWKVGKEFGLKEQKTFEKASADFRKWQNEMMRNSNMQTKYLTNDNLIKGYIPYKTGNFEFRLILNKPMLRRMLINNTVAMEGVTTITNTLGITQSERAEVSKAFRDNMRIIEPTQKDILQNIRFNENGIYKINQQTYSKLTGVKLQTKDLYAIDTMVGGKRTEFIFSMSKGGKISNLHMMIKTQIAENAYIAKIGKVVINVKNPVVVQTQNAKLNLYPWRVDNIQYKLITGEGVGYTNVLGKGLLGNKVILEESVARAIIEDLKKVPSLKSMTWEEFLGSDIRFYMTKDGKKLFSGNIAIPRLAGEETTIKAVTRKEIMDVTNKVSKALMEREGVLLTNKNIKVINEVTGIRVTTGSTSKNIKLRFDEFNRPFFTNPSNDKVIKYLTEIEKQALGRLGNIIDPKPLSTPFGLGEARPGIPKVPTKPKLPQEDVFGLGNMKKIVERPLTTKETGKLIEKVVPAPTTKIVTTKLNIPKVTPTTIPKVIPTLPDSANLFGFNSVPNIEVLALQQPEAITIQNLNNLEIQLQNNKTQQRSITGISNDQSKRQMELLKEREEQIKKQIELQKEIQKVRQRQLQRLKQEQLQRQRQLELQRLEGVRTSPTSIPPTPPYVNPFVLTPPTISSPTTKKKVRKTIPTTKPISYIKEVRTKGKWVPVKGRYASYGEAMASGVHKTSTTLRASFRIKKVEKAPNSRISSLVVMDMMNMLRSRFYESPKEKGVWMEKPTYRLSTKTEVKEIQEAKRRAERDRSFWFG